MKRIRDLSTPEILHAVAMKPTPPPPGSIERARKHQLLQQAKLVKGQSIQRVHNQVTV